MIFYDSSVSLSKRTKFMIHAGSPHLHVKQNVDNLVFLSSLNLIKDKFWSFYVTYQKALIFTFISYIAIHVIQFLSYFIRMLITLSRLYRRYQWKNILFTFNAWFTLESFSEILYEAIFTTLNTLCGIWDA